MKARKRVTTVRTILASVILCGGLLALPGIAGAQSVERRQSPADSFFIISSVDAKKQQIVLKLPTEVTEIVKVTAATTYRDEKGRPLKFEDLRAGDTVYATLKRDADGTLAVASLRRGPMTLEELHSRYIAEE